MKISKTTFEGLLTIEPSLFADNRGCFYESWRENTYFECVVSEKLVQDNISVSKKNVLRGLHYQKNQGQLVWVSYGHIFDVALDIRRTSPTFGKYFAQELSADKPIQIYMPEGFAHGFCVLSDIAVINYKCTRYYTPKNEGTIIWNDPVANIKWPISTPIISAKDAEGKLLSDV